MNSGFEFVLAGVPVKVMWWFFVVSALLGSLLRDPVLIAIWVAVVFVSVLLHEMGHAIAYRTFGIQPSIVLQGMGGLTYGRSLPPGKDLIVSVAGPAVGLIIGAATWYVDENMRFPSLMVTQVVGIIFFVNFFWALFNQLPLLPLDGGNALNSLLSLVLRRDMTQVVRVVSIATGVGLIFFAVQRQFLYGALLVGFFVYQNFQALQAGPRGKGRFAPKVYRPGTSRPPSPPSGAPPSTPGSTGEAWTRPRTDEQGNPSPIETVGWVMPSSKRTFADEIDSATQALSRDEPEIAAIAVDRARRLAQTINERAVADQVHTEVLRRISGA